MAEGKPFIKCGELFDHTDAFDYNTQTEQLFIDAMNEALRWHANHCPDYRAFLAENGLVDFKQKYLSEQIPPLLVTILKEFKLTSVPEKLAKLELVPSDSEGRKSQIFLDARSYKRILKIVESIFGSLGLVDHKTKANYVCFTCDPQYSLSPATAFSDKLLTGLTAHRSVYYAIKPDKKSGEFSFDLETAAKKLIDFNHHPEPVRILGLPSCLWQVCEWLEKNGINLKLGSRSYIITGSGWEMHNVPEISRNTFNDRINKVLGIPKENIRSMFGIIEHGIPYVECECGRIHVPVYARAMCVDPETLFPVEDGEEGLLHLMTPYISSYPSISLLTTNKAVVEDNCPCGRSGKTLRIIGKSDQAKSKGSAISALELIK